MPRDIFVVVVVVSRRWQGQPSQRKPLEAGPLGWRNSVMPVDLDPMKTRHPGLVYCRTRLTNSPRLLPSGIWHNSTGRRQGPQAFPSWWWNTGTQIAQAPPTGWESDSRRCAWRTLHPPAVTVPAPCTSPKCSLNFPLPVASSDRC